MPLGSRIIIPFERRYYAQRKRIVIVGILDAMIARMEKTWFRWNFSKLRPLWEKVNGKRWRCWNNDQDEDELTGNVNGSMWQNYSVAAGRFM